LYTAIAAARYLGQGGGPPRCTRNRWVTIKLRHA
jgi:hypothetical protein